MTDQGITSTVQWTDSDYRLCYVSGQWAYFTTKDIEKQWGDDWNDAPYEHNAGTPYEYRQYNADNGDAPWDILKVAIYTELETPADKATYNSNWAVDDMNRKAVPWLSPSQWYSKVMPVVTIFAGVTLPEFIQLIQLSGGEVYRLVEKVTV